MIRADRRPCVLTAAATRTGQQPEPTYRNLNRVVAYAAFAANGLRGERPSRPATGAETPPHQRGRCVVVGAIRGRRFRELPHRTPPSWRTPHQRARTHGGCHDGSRPGFEHDAMGRGRRNIRHQERGERFPRQNTRRPPPGWGRRGNRSPGRSPRSRCRRKRETDESETRSMRSSSATSRRMAHRVCAVLRMKPVSTQLKCRAGTCLGERQSRA